MRDARTAAEGVTRLAGRVQSRERQPVTPPGDVVSFVSATVLPDLQTDDKRIHFPAAVRRLSATVGSGLPVTSDVTVMAFTTSGRELGSVTIPAGSTHAFAVLQGAHVDGSRDPIAWTATDPGDSDWTSITVTAELWGSQHVGGHAESNDPGWLVLYWFEEV